MQFKFNGHNDFLVDF